MAELGWSDCGQLVGRDAARLAASSKKSDPLGFHGGGELTVGDHKHGR